MLFVEFRFFIFFLVVFCVYWALRSNSTRKVWLLLCSYCFYAAWDWRFLFILMASTTLDYTIGIVLTRVQQPRARKVFVTLSLCINLGLLGFFKYYNFFVTSAAELLAWLGLPASVSTLQIIIPVGVSFYTFQSMSYTIDVYRGRLQAVTRFLDLAFFVSFFPQLVAGPIVRASTFLPQVGEKRRFANVDVRGALVLFMVGFFKKACIAESVAPFVDNYFAAPGTYTALSSWVGVLFYALQIYCDFSGYTDMAIASSRLLGYELTLNFHYPYLAANITDFWRRWHISLSTWLRDYLYIPLGGNRGSILFTYRNLMLTMVLGGLWHGGSWNFAIWGGLHGLALILHREWMRFRERIPFAARAMNYAGVVITFYSVCVAWIFFRAPDLRTSWQVVSAFVAFQSPGTNALRVPLLLLPFAGLAVVHYLNSRGAFATWWRRGPDVLFAAGYGCATAVILLFIPMQYKPFIYFQF